MRPAPRRVEVLPVPTGDGVLALLPALSRALDGRGPALLPTGPADPRPEVGAQPALGPDEDDDRDPTALVVSTSGSTGVAKRALLPVSALRGSALATQRRLGGPGHWLLALPAQHIAGLQVLLRSVLAGTAPTVLDLAAGFSPRAFVAAAGRCTGERRFVSLVPAQLARLLAGDEAPEGPAALAGFDAVLVGAAATPATLLGRAVQAGVRIVRTYGMSETCGGCVYDERPLDGVQVRVDEAGRILLGGPVVARGYLGRPADPAFRTADDGTRWFGTDDCGFLAGDRLRVTGRADDVIVTGGYKLAPSVLEAELARLPWVAEVAVVGVPDDRWGRRVVAAVVPQPGLATPDLVQLRASLAERGLPGYAAPHQLLVVDRMPRRGPGKTDRAELVRWAAREKRRGSGSAGR